MFLPYDTTVNLWFFSSSIYAWESVPPVGTGTNPTGAVPIDGAADADAACAPGGLPAMRLVFKGVKWTAYPVFGMRTNPQFDSVSQTRREVDQEHLDDNQREARKAPKPVVAPAQGLAGEPSPETDW